MGTLKLNNVTAITESGGVVSLSPVNSVTLTPATTPGSPAEGQLYYDSALDVMKFWNGTAWQFLLSGSQGPMAGSGGNSTAEYTLGGTNYKAHTFTSSGTFGVSTAGAVDIFLVAGGGSGGGDNGGGGGAGGVLIALNYSLAVGNYAIVIGGGGSRTTGYHTKDGTPGVDTTMAITGGTAYAKGGAKGHATDAGEGAVVAGGSGAGGSHPAYNAPSSSNQQSYIPTGFTGYGHSGGDGRTSSDGGGGGGGAGGEGGDSGIIEPGFGGPGIANNFRDGSNMWYAGGGAGGEVQADNNGRSHGGIGGGGRTGIIGGDYNLDASGRPNTGGGGGGGAQAIDNSSGAGGSGIAIVRYMV